MTNPERIVKGLWWDRAWSLVGGCSYVSPGCANCWSASEAHMRAGQKNPKIRDRYAGLTDGGKWTGEVRLMEGNLGLPPRVRKSTTWAVWNDLFHEEVPDEFIYRALRRMRECEQHIFLVLTKRPEHMKQVIEKFQFHHPGFWPLPNVWLGTTSENQGQADKRIPILLQIPAAVRFISVEPMLGPVDLTGVMVPAEQDQLNPTGFCPSKFNALTTQYDDVHYHQPPAALDWVICGGESGPGARPMHPDWASNLRDQCQAAGVSFFFKQWGEWGPLGSKFGNPDSWSGRGSAPKSWKPPESLNWNPKWDGKPIEMMDRGTMVKVGKKEAGRLLDGRTWDEFPDGDPNPGTIPWPTVARR